MKLRERAALLRGVALLLERELERELARVDAERAQPSLLSDPAAGPDPGGRGGKDLAAERDRLRRAWRDLSAAAARAERKLADRCGDECG